MLDSLADCSLIYVKENRVNGKPVEEEHIKEGITCTIGDVYASRYYEGLNRDVKLTCVIEVRSYHKMDYKGGQLRYVFINGKKQVVDSIDPSKGQYVLLTLKELK